MNQWEEVTNIFEEAAQQLGKNAVKPMLNSDNFSLFESMSAVELMDPKMDQCCAFSSELSVETLSTIYRMIFPIHNGCDEVSQTNLLQGICLQLQSIFAAQISVINGASIMESTHNWIIVWKVCWEYLEAQCYDNDFSAFLGRVLVSFGKSVNKVIGLITNAVLNADIYEDEDFSPNFRQFIFDKDLDAKAIAQQLQSLASDIPHWDTEVSEQLLTLLQMQSQLLLLCNDFDEYVSTTIGFCNRILKVRKSHASASDEDGRKKFQSIGESVKYFNMKRFKAPMKNFYASVQSAAQNLLFSDKEDYALSLYKPCLARLHLVGPLHKVEKVTFSDSLRSVEKICKDLTMVHDLSMSLPDHLEVIVSSQDVFAYVGEHTISWEQLFQQFSDLSRKNLHLLSRSFLVATHHIISLDLSTYILNAMHQRGIPKSVLAVSSVIDEWITGNPCLAAWESMKSTSVCRNRIISRMENILVVWGHVSSEANYMDERVRVELALPKDSQHQWFSSWSITMTTRFMDLYMQLLMDMEVVDKKEYDSLFWYWDYIYTTHIHAIDKLRALNYQLEMALYEAKQLEYRTAINAKDKKGNKKNKQKLSEPVPPTILPPFAEDLINRGKGQLSRGLFRVNIIMKQLGLLPRHKNQYTSTGCIFEHRFRPFQDVVNPHPLSYRDFIQTINKDTNIESDAGNFSFLGDESEIVPIEELSPVLQSAITCFQNARKCFDEAKKSNLIASNSLSNDDNFLKMLTNLTKVSVASLLNATKLSKMLDESRELTSSKVTISRSYDSYFPVHEIKE